MKQKKRGTVAVNRKATFNVAVADTYEAGIQLTGDEIKSIRQGRLQLNGAYVRLLKSRQEVPEVVLVGMNLSGAAEPERTRKLLLNKREIEELRELLDSKGRVVTPLDIHFVRGWAKLKIGVGTGRKNYDKRQLLKERDIDRDTRQEVDRRR